MTTETFMPAPGKNYKGPMLPQFVLGKEITFGAKVMYAVLCNYAARYNTDHCDPSHSTLAKLLSCGITSVKRYLAELTGANLIRIELREQESNIYYMLKPDALDELKDVCGEQKVALHPQQSKVACTPSKMDSPQAKVGYISNLNKKQEENTNPPLPPVPVSRSIPPAPRPVGGGGSFSSDFEELWEAYPRKDAKAPAEQAFKQLLRSRLLPSLPDLLAAIKRFLATTQWQKENGRFIPYLSNFLTKRRWLDPLSDEEAETNRKRLEAERIELARKQAEEAKEARKAEEKQRLRPIFDAFAARFGEEAREDNTQIDNMRFGTWKHSYGKYAGPTAADVPDGTALSIMDFLDSYKRHREREAYLATQQAEQETAPRAPVIFRDSYSHSDNRERKPILCADILHSDFMTRFLPAPRPLCAAV